MTERNIDAYWRVAMSSISSGYVAHGGHYLLAVVELLDKGEGRPYGSPSEKFIRELCNFVEHYREHEYHPTKESDNARTYWNDLP